MIQQLPNDAMLCLSVVNTKLRDCYSSLDELCESMVIDKDELIRKLKDIDYEYEPSTNQFI